MSPEECDRRIANLLVAALSLATIDPAEAECLAYEAGRYACGSNAGTSGRLVGHKALARSFARGRADAPADQADQARAAALAGGD